MAVARGSPRLAHHLFSYGLPLLSFSILFCFGVLSKLDFLSSDMNLSMYFSIEVALAWGGGEYTSWE